jgi:hypothetical protein
MKKKKTITFLVHFPDLLIILRRIRRRDRDGSKERGVRRK